VNVHLTGSFTILLAHFDDPATGETDSSPLAYRNMMMSGGVTDFAPRGQNRSLANRGMPSSGLQLRNLRRAVLCSLWVLGQWSSSCCEADAT
jgi:hypothetical protein